MRMPAALLALLILLSTACGSPAAPPATGGTGAATAPGSSGAPSGAPVAATSADLTGEILGTLLFASLDDALTQGTGLIQPQLPPALQGMMQADMLKMQLFKAIGIEDLPKAIDTSRPLAIALANPKTYTGQGLGPLMAAIPVKDPAVLVDILTKEADRHESTPQKDHLFYKSDKPLFLRVHQGYALFAGHERLLAGAAKVLMPLVEAAPRHLALVSADMAVINAQFAKEIEEALSEIKVEMNKEPLGTMGSSGKMVERWIGYLRSAGKAELALHLVGTSTLRLDLSVAAQPKGELATYLGRLNAGPSWGLDYLPVESALVAVSRDNPEMLLEDVNEGFAALDELVKKLAPQINLGSWKTAIVEAIKHNAGEGSGALWASTDGSLGIGGATRLKDGAAARESMRTWMAFLQAELTRLQAQFKKEINEALPGFKITLKHKKDALKLKGGKGDLFTLGLTWPKLKDKGDQADLDKAKKAFEKVLGKELTIGYAVVGDVGLMAMGKDHKKRLEAMAATAAGGKGSGLDAKLKSLTAGRDLLVMVHTPLEALLEQGLRVADRVTTIPVEVRDLMTKVMPPAGTEVPVTFLMVRSGDQVSFEAGVSANLVGMIGRGMMEYMNRSGAKMAP